MDIQEKGKGKHDLNYFEQEVARLVNKFDIAILKAIEGKTFELEIENLQTDISFNIDGYTSNLCSVLRIENNMFLCKNLDVPETTQTWLSLDKMKGIYDRLEILDSIEDYEG
jgi:hypothetical protein